MCGSAAALYLFCAIRLGIVLQFCVALSWTIDMAVGPVLCCVTHQCFMYMSYVVHIFCLVCVQQAPQPQTGCILCLVSLKKGMPSVGDFSKGMREKKLCSHPSSPQVCRV